MCGGWGAPPTLTKIKKKIDIAFQWMWVVISGDNIGIFDLLKCFVFIAHAYTASQRYHDM